MKLEFSVEKITTPSTVVETTSGTYAIVNAKWHLVPAGTKLSDITVVEVSPVPKTVTPRLSRKEFIHQSARSGEAYTIVRKSDGSWLCECIGFSVHKKCKHVDFFKTTIND